MEGQNSCKHFQKPGMTIVLEAMVLDRRRQSMYLIPVLAQVLVKKFTALKSGPCAWKIPHDCVYDGEVGKRLNQMICVLHTPKTNGEIPSVDEATLDHRRLPERLQLYGLVERKVEGDGNCQDW